MDGFMKVSLYKTVEDSMTMDSGESRLQECAKCPQRLIYRNFYALDIDFFTSVW